MKKVRIKNKNREIPAIIRLPDGLGPFPAVVMNHGHGGSKEEHGGFTDISKALAKRGIATIAMDFPGCGESLEPFTENYISNMISDSNASLKYLLENYNVDQDNLGILGFSMGGRISLEVINSKQSIYKSIGLLAPSSNCGKGIMVDFLGGEEKYKGYLKEAMSEKGYAEFENPYIGNQKLSTKWFSEMEVSNPLKDKVIFKGNMLVVYGGKDTTVPPSENEKLLSKYSNSKGVLIEEADHLFGFIKNDKAIKNKVEVAFADFFEKELK